MYDLHYTTATSKMTYKQTFETDKELDREIGIFAMSNEITGWKVFDEQGKCIERNNLNYDLFGKTCFFIKKEGKKVTAHFVDWFTKEVSIWGISDSYFLDLDFRCKLERRTAALFLYNKIYK